MKNNSLEELKNCICYRRTMITLSSATEGFNCVSNFCPQCSSNIKALRERSLFSFGTKTVSAKTFQLHYKTWDLETHFDWLEHILIGGLKNRYSHLTVPCSKGQCHFWQFSASAVSNGYQISPKIKKNLPSSYRVIAHLNLVWDFSPILDQKKRRHSWTERDFAFKFAEMTYWTSINVVEKNSHLRKCCICPVIDPPYRFFGYIAS